VIVWPIYQVKIENSTIMTYNDSVHRGREYDVFLHIFRNIHTILQGTWLFCGNRPSTLDSFSQLSVCFCRVAAMKHLRQLLR